MGTHVATPERPNILLITTDQQRFDALRLNNPDTPLRTQHTDALAAGGINFTRGYTTCPVCIPARRTLLTGLHPTTHGLVGYQDGQPWDPPFTIPGLVRDAGYQTQLIGKLHQWPQRKRFGFDNMILSDSPNHRPASGFHPHNDYTEWLAKLHPHAEPNNHGINGNSRNARPFNLDENLHQTSWLADQAIDFLTRRRDPSCPWFLHLSFWAPHPPLVPPQAYWDMYRDHDVAPVHGDWAAGIAEARSPAGRPSATPIGPFDEAELQRARAGYFGLIHHIDDRINAVLDRYFEYGTPQAKEPVLIIFTSDHGEMLGDHHLWRKSLPYEASAHVPFFVSGMNMDTVSGTSDALVSLEDAAATILDASGAEVPDALAGVNEGTSLMPALRGETLHTRDRLFGQIAAGPTTNHYVVEGPLKYVRFTRTGDEQLFDVLADPQDLHDLSADAERLLPMRALLDEHLKATGQHDPAAPSPKPCENQLPKAFAEQL
ncbi:MAG: sulfatase-like hydrolase/transferase [Planctomycetota bacterium]